MKREKALQLYSLLLKVYPREYRHAFGAQMLQTFKDYYTDVEASADSPGAGFWFDVARDEVKGIVRERILSLKGYEYMKNTWVKQGVLFGVILGIVHIAYNFIISLAPANITLNSLLNNGILIIVLIFVGAAGYATAHKAGKIREGTYAGLFTGTLSIIIGISTSLIITLIFIDTIRHNAFTIYDFQRSGLKSIDQFIIEDTLGAAFVGTFFSLVAGVVFGTIGGYFGKFLMKQA